MSKVDLAYPYTITLDNPYARSSESGCNIFGNTILGDGVRGFQYIVTFDSNLGDLPALKVDGAGLIDAYTLNGSETEAKVRERESFLPHTWVLEESLTPQTSIHISCDVNDIMSNKPGDQST